MFSGLTGFFKALARLTTSINRSADLFDAANGHLEQQFAIDAPERPALPAPEEMNGNGRRRKVAAE